MIIPYDVVLRIVDFTGETDVFRVLLAFLPKMTRSAAELAKERRMDPRRLLSELVSDPVALLARMRECSVVLTGSRAAGLFNPSVCTDDSDWNFFARDDPRAVLSFVTHLHREGFIWQGRSGRETGIDLHTDIGSYCMSGRNDSFVTITVHTSESSIWRILAHGLSISHCMVSGYFALNPYRTLSAGLYSLFADNPRRSMGDWMYYSTYGSDGDSEFESENWMTKKITARGISMVSWSAMSQLLDDSMGGYMRYLWDDQCTTSKSSRMYGVDDSEWESWHKGIAWECTHYSLYNSVWIRPYNSKEHHFSPSVGNTWEGMIARMTSDLLTDWNTASKKRVASALAEWITLCTGKEREMDGIADSRMAEVLVDMALHSNWFVQSAEMRRLHMF